MAMYCPKCGAQLPDGAAFCMKCGASVTAAQPVRAAGPAVPVLAPTGAKALTCPSCGAPISPQFGEMVITCAYCGSGVTLANVGWKGIEKQTMLPIRIASQDQVLARVRELMDKGLLHRHLQASSKLEEMNLSLVPYWIVSVAARTTVVASDVAAEAGQIATTAALVGLMGGMMGGRFGGRRGGMGFAGPLVAGTVMGGMMGGGIGGSGTRKSYEFADNYTFPVVALKALFEHQPRDYRLNLEERTFFDVTKVPKSVTILNGDVGEDGARNEARALVAQLQSEKAHAQYHMIQDLHSDVEAADVELLHAPIWFARYDHEGRKIALVIDANSGGVINSIGL